MRTAIVAALILAACSSKKPPSQDEPKPDVARSPVTLKVVNHRATPIWVQAQTECAQWPVAIADPDDLPVQVDGQAVDCATARAGNCPTMGGCQGAGVTKVEPGQALTQTWDATRWAWRELKPGEAGPYCPSSCVDHEPAPAGAYTISAAAWSACEGECKGLPDLTAKATLAVPDATSAEVVFQ